MPPETAKALKKALRGTAAHRAYPGAESASEKDMVHLEQFNLLLSDTSLQQHKQDSSQVRTLNVDGNTAPAQMVAGNDSPHEEGSSTAPKEVNMTPEEIAEEARKKEMKKQLQQEKASQPVNAVKTWLHSLPKELKDAKLSKKETDDANNVPAEQRQEYKTKFEEHEEALKTLRVELEDAQASKTEDKVDLKAARVAIVRLKNDIKAWAQVKTLYK